MKKKASAAGKSGLKKWIRRAAAPAAPAAPWRPFPSWALCLGGCNCGGLPAVVLHGGGVVTVRCPDCGARYDRTETRAEVAARILAERGAA